MIEGLTLTFSGEELRTLLDEAVQRHDASASHWAHEAERKPEDQTEDAPLLPEHMCEHEAERHTWRAEVLAFLRDHIEPAEIYRLGAADLEYGELLPDKPGSLTQEEYEERTRIGFTLERLVKSMNHFGGLAYALLDRPGASRDTDQPG